MVIRYFLTISHRLNGHINPTRRKREKERKRARRIMDLLTRQRRESVIERERERFLDVKYRLVKSGLCPACKRGANPPGSS